MKYATWLNSRGAKPYFKNYNLSLFITSYELSGANNVGVGMINGNIETKRLEHNELKIFFIKLRRLKRTMKIF